MYKETGLACRNKPDGCVRKGSGAGEDLFLCGGGEFNRTKTGCVAERDGEETFPVNVNYEKGEAGN